MTENEYKILRWEVRITWNDGEVEVMQKSLPDSLLREIEQHMVDLEDLRTQEPDQYFLEAI